MTPDEAMTAAYRAAVKETAQGAVRLDAYEDFLIATSDSLEKAAQAFTKIAMERPTATKKRMEMREKYALFQMMQATVGALMSLAHFPYLRGADSPEDVS